MPPLNKKIDFEVEEKKFRMDASVGMSLFVDLGESKSSFNLEKVVCNHGFFMMAPNHWIPSSKTLERPLRLADNKTCVSVSILHPPPPNHTSLLVRVHGTRNISHTDEHAILEQVRRMLRISAKDERDVREYQKVHPQAMDKGLGRLFRSPTFFEDLVKCLLLCNCRWSNTLKMARALCELQLVLSNSSARSGQKRNRENPCKVSKCNNDRCLGNFPSSKELASLDENFLKNHNVNLGYRARHILNLAKDVESGKVQLDESEQTLDNQQMLLPKFMKIKGFGSFASANALMCIGYYQKVPIDSETIRHLQEVHGRKHCNQKTIAKDVEEIYDKYAPFQCLAYWSELLEYYESKFGKLSELPNSNYHMVSGRLELFDCKSK